MPLVVGETTTLRTLLLRLKNWVAGFGSVGDALLLVDTAASARTVLGAGATGGPMFVTGTAASGRTVLGLGTAAVKNTGASGNAVPLLNAAANTWAGTQIIDTTAVSPFDVRRTGAPNMVTTRRILPTLGAAGNSISENYNFRDDAGTEYQGAIVRATQIDAAAASRDTSFAYFTVTAGAALAQQLSLSNGLVVGAATGGAQGYGTINAQGVYDDGVLLTCYPFEALFDGGIDLAAWDARVPNRERPATYREVRDEAGNIVGETLAQESWTEVREHFGARKFAARLGTEYDPLDIDKYAAHWREKRHLTSLPNEANYDPAKPLSTGEWLQRLVETVEIQAIHIARLNDRVKVLEGR